MLFEGRSKSFLPSCWERVFQNPDNRRPGMLSPEDWRRHATDEVVCGTAVSWDVGTGAHLGSQPPGIVTSFCPQRLLSFWTISQTVLLPWFHRADNTSDQTLWGIVQLAVPKSRCLAKKRKRSPATFPWAITFKEFGIYVSVLTQSFWCH